MVNLDHYDFTLTFFTAEKGGHHIKAIYHIWTINSYDFQTILSYGHVYVLQIGLYTI